MKRITMYIPQAVFDIIGKIAKTKRIPYSQVIRGAIWELLKKERLIGQDLQDDLTLQAQCYVKK